VEYTLGKIQDPQFKQPASCAGSMLRKANSLPSAANVAKRHFANQLRTMTQQIVMAGPVVYKNI
jgi:hypothetical protein